MAKKLRANFKLERNFKRKWVAALRSGKYRQTASHLYVGYGGGGFCCLGVMCALRGAKLNEMDQVGLPGELPNFNELFNIDSDHVDFFSGGGEAWQVPYCGEMVYLSELNDNHRLSFKQIANIIERSVDTY